MTYDRVRVARTERIVLENHIPLTLRLDGDRASIRAPRVEDAEAFIELRRRSRDHLLPWIPTPPSDDADLELNRRRLLVERRNWRTDKGYGFCIVDRATDEVIGRVNLNQIVRGVFFNAYVGYWIDTQFAGRGLMTEALRLAVTAAFGPLGLHRVQAAIIPRNEPSIAVARKVGFREEGRAARYLKIAGKWEDHLLFAITAEEWDRRG